MISIQVTDTFMFLTRFRSFILPDRPEDLGELFMQFLTVLVKHISYPFCMGLLFEHKVVGCRRSDRTSEGKDHHKCLPRISIPAQPGDLVARPFYTSHDDKVKEGEEEKEEKEEVLHEDLDLTLQRSDAEMTDAQAHKDTKDSHVTLTVVPPVMQQQISLVSSDLVLKFINPSTDTGIDSILNQNIQSHNLVDVLVFVATETPSSDTTPPQPPIPNIQPLQQTPNPTTTTTILTITMPDIPDFATLFRFDQRVSAFIVDNYLASKMKDAVDVAAQLQSNKLREEAQAKNQEFLNLIDSNVKTIIKEQVKAQVAKIITESIGAKVLVRSTNQPQTSYAVAASLLEFELKKILIDKIETNKSIDKSDIQKDLYKALVELYNSNKDIIYSYGDVVTLKKGRDDQKKDEDHSVGSNRGSKRKRSGKEAKSSKEPTHKEYKSTSSLKGASRSHPKSLGKFAYVEEHDQ
ncbi:hypothetical protein Tco_0668366 [Tanacetum coccineum]